MRERNRQVVPLGVIAHHGGRVHHAVIPLDARPPHGCIDRISQNDVNRDAVAIGIEDRHRRMLQPDCAVSKYSQRFAGNLGVAMRHAHRGFFMTASDELGSFVAAVIDHRFMQAAKARSRIRADVFDPQGLDYIHHEVRAWVFRREHFSGRRPRFSCLRHQGSSLRRCRCGLRRGHCACCRDQSGHAASGRGFQEVSTV